jgi:pimeloyl-ACP methyl ester carboxylesterase
MSKNEDSIIADSSLLLRSDSIFLIDRGEGPPIFFIHGNPDSADVWLPLIDRLQGYRCIAPDLPGFGRSTLPKGFRFSLPELADFIKRAMNQANVTEPVHLVVHDFGGPFGFAWAVSHPEKVQSICVMNTTFFSDYRWHRWAKIWRTPLLGEISMATMNWPLFLKTMRQNLKNVSDEEIRKTYDKITPQMKKAVLKLYRATNPENFVGWEDRLLALTARVPTLVLWADHDPYISPRFAQRYRAKKVVHFLETGHWVMLEHPDKVAIELKAFWDSNLQDNAG